LLREGKTENQNHASHHCLVYEIPGNLQGIELFRMLTTAVYVHNFNLAKAPRKIGAWLKMDTIFGINEYEMRGNRLVKKQRKNI